MKTPLALPALALMTGILIASRFSFSPQGYWAALCFHLPFLWGLRGRRFFLPCLFSALICLGALTTELALRRPPHAVERFVSENRLTLEGVVQSSPEIKIRGKRKVVSFILRSERLKTRAHGRRQSRKVEGDVQVFLYYPEGIPEWGDRIRIWGRLEQPKSPMNPGEFDYRAFLARKEIYCLWTAYGTRAWEKIGPAGPFFFRRFIERTRIRLENRIQGIFKKENAAIWSALLLGKRKNVEPAFQDDLMKTGTSHLLAISGLNVSLVTGTLYLIFIALRVPQKIAAVFALAAVGLYVEIAGSGIPVQRAGWMSAFALIALLADREAHTLNLFCLALILLLAARPQSLGDISLQLSFLSVLALIIYFRFRKPPSKIVGLVESALAVLVGGFPVVLYHFYVFSPMSLLANFAAIPLFHMALLGAFMSLAIFWPPGLNEIICRASDFILDLGLDWIHLCALPRWGYFYLERPRPAQIFIYYLLVLSLLLLWKRGSGIFRWVKAGLLGLWLAVFISFFHGRQGPVFQLTLLAAGRNDIAYLQWNARTHWLINTGRGHPSSQARWIVEPFLKSRGIKHLDGIILTDFAQKHTGGLETLQRNFSIRHLAYPADWERKDFRGRFSEWKRLQRASLGNGERIDFEQGQSLEILETWRGSLVLLVQNRGGKWLFLPSFDEELLRRLEGYRDILFDIDVLILLSSAKTEGGASEKFFDWVDPLAVATPTEDPALKSLLKERDIPFYALEHTGALSFTADPLAIDSFREGRLAYG